MPLVHASQRTGASWNCRALTQRGRGGVGGYAAAPMATEVLRVLDRGALEGLRLQKGRACRLAFFCLSSLMLLPAAAQAGVPINVTSVSIRKVEIADNNKGASQEYTFNGKNNNRVGFFARVKLEDFSTGNICPHEFTLAKAKQDRTQLIRACKANFSPVFGLYSDPEGVLDGKLAAVIQQPPLVTIEEDSIINRLWRVDDSATLEFLSAQFAGKKVIIADGHHRYETALSYHQEYGVPDSAHFAGTDGGLRRSSHENGNPPAEISENVRPPATGTGRLLLTVVPSPSCPRLFRPQHTAVPSSNRPHECSSPPVLIWDIVRTLMPTLNTEID